MDEEKLECVWCREPEVEITETAHGLHVAACSLCGARGPAYYERETAERLHLDMLVARRMYDHIKLEV